MESDETVLYTKDAKGDIREWAISHDGETITIRYGFVGGTMQYQYEEIKTNSSGRDFFEQAELRVDSRISRQLDKGYVYSINKAREGKATNRMGKPKPMLAQKVDDVRGIDWDNAIVQPKFDGNRCLIYCEDGVNKAYTRNGKPVEAIDHILQDITLEEGMIVDGELYCHGQKLQTIVSWIKRKQEQTKQLKYHLYDFVAPDLSYKLRSEIIKGIPKGSSIEAVYGLKVASREALQLAFRAYRAGGYEGAILRWGDFGYEDGKRSKSLLKLKEFHSDEFKVIDIIKSNEGWGILVCELQDRTGTFKVSAPGDMAEKYSYVINKDLYIGKDVTVEYAGLTNLGVPFHPIAINFREDIQ